MLQFYFLSILLNCFSGLILLFGKDLCSEQEKDDDPDKKSGSRLFGENGIADSATFRMVLGILTGFVGLMKFLSVISDGTPIIGDLLPALAGICAGSCLLYEQYRMRSGSSRPAPAFFERCFVGGRRYIGWGSIIVSLLHFLMPQVTIL